MNGFGVQATISVHRKDCLGPASPRVWDGAPRTICRVSEDQKLLSSKLIVGEASVRRVGAVRFPVWDLVIDGKTLARLGRMSWWSIYFGFGQKVQLVDGSQWRIRSVESNGMISALVVNSAGLKVALGSIGSSGYLIVGKDFSYKLLPLRSNAILLPNEWILSSDDAICARVQRHPMRITALAPVPVSAAVIAMALLRVGIPGDKKMSYSSVNWTGGR